MLTVEVEHLGEDVEVEILVPRWAMHKLKGGEPSDLFEEEGGESMWELYVHDAGAKAAQKAFEAKAAKLDAEEKIKDNRRLAKLKEAFNVFDEGEHALRPSRASLLKLSRRRGLFFNLCALPICLHAASSCRACITPSYPDPTHL